MGQVARPHERVRVARSEMGLEFGRIAHTRREQPRDISDELLVVARVQV